MTDLEYSKWILVDTLKGAALASATYALALLAYWFLVR